MANIKIPIHKINLPSRIDGICNWNIDKKEKEKIIQFLGDLSIGKVNKGFKITESRQIRYIDMLKTPLEFINKPCDKIKLKDIEEFEKALTSDSIKSKFKGKPFAQDTKSTMKKMFKIYLKWRLGETKAFTLTNWLDIRSASKTPDFLTENEMEKLYRASDTNELRFLIAVLFDSGARAEEFHNIRFEDIEMPEGKNNFVRITLKEEYSKTDGRVIGLYWKHSIDAVKDYLEYRKKEGIKSDEQIFNSKYDNMRQALARLGKKVLDKSIHYHLFRSSSATYYASKLNRQELCYRYGWKFSSNMPDIYISRSGMVNKQLEEKFTNTELSELKDRLYEQEQKNKILLDEQNKLKEEVKEIKEMNKKVMEKLKNLN